MNAKLFFKFSFIFLFSTAVMAGEVYDYTEALNKEFTISKKAKLIKISVTPRLIEREFADFLIEPLEKEMPRKEIIAKWKPIQKKLIQDGFVFEVKLELLNKNLDSGIDVELIGDLTQNFSLENNLGEKVLMYKCTGKKARSLNFMTPEVTLICYFNSKTEKGNPLIRRGVTSLTLKINKLSEGIPDTSFKWSFPLNYYNVKRPQAIKSYFGLKQIRTFRVYKPLVYHKPKTIAIPHIKRIKRKEETDDE